MLAILRAREQAAAEHSMSGLSGPTAGDHEFPDIEPRVMYHMMQN